jgi:hypothetical protein
MNKSYFNTFIIPTIGRSTLKQAIESVVTFDNTLIIVVYDGNKQDPPVSNNNVIYLETKKLCKNAGFVRNFGISHVIKNINTEYISFLDDDDIIKPNFNNVITNHKSYDVIIHSIEFPYHPISRKKLPLKSGIGISRGDMGIAMSIKVDALRKHNVKFTDTVGEDYIFAKSLIDKGSSHYKTGIITYIALSKGNWKEVKRSIND